MKNEIYDPNNKIVKMHNNFINSKGKSSLLMLKLLAACISKLPTNQEDELNVKIAGAELKKVFRSKSNSFYQQIKDIVQPKSKNEPTILDYRQIYMNPEKQEIKAYNVITSATFKNNTLDLKFNPDLKGILYDFKNNFTRMNLEVLMELRSIYSYRLYQILKADFDKLDSIEKKNGKPGKNPYTVQINLIDLKMRLGIIDSSTSQIIEALNRCDYETIDKITSHDEEANRYRDYGNLRKNALEKARIEIDKCEQAEIYFKYKPVRTGRGGKTTAINFMIYGKKAKNKEIVPIPTAEQYKVVDKISEVISEPLKPSEYQIIAEAADYDIDKVKSAYEIAKRNGNVRNLVGFMVKAIKDEYSAPTPLEKMQTHPFTNFEQRTINLDDLEKRILDN